MSRVCGVLDRFFCKWLGHKWLGFNHDLTGFVKDFQVCARCGKIMAYNAETDEVIYSTDNGETVVRYH